MGGDARVHNHGVSAGSQRSCLVAHPPPQTPVRARPAPPPPCPRNGCIFARSNIAKQMARSVRFLIWQASRGMAVTGGGSLQSSDSLAFRAASCFPPLSRTIPMFERCVRGLEGWPSSCFLSGDKLVLRLCGGAWEGAGSVARCSRSLAPSPARAWTSSGPWTPRVPWPGRSTPLSALPCGSQRA